MLKISKSGLPPGQSKGIFTIRAPVGANMLQPFSILGLMLLMVSAPSMVLMTGSPLYDKESDWSALRFGLHCPITHLEVQVCTAKIALQQLHWKNCTAKIALQEFHWKNCIETLHCCVDIVAITIPRVVCSWAFLPSSGWPAVGAVSTSTRASWRSHLFIQR